MQETYTNKPSDDFKSSDIDLQEIFYVLLEGKIIILGFTALISTIALIYSLLLPNIYESKALLVPVESSNSIAGALGGYSSLAGFAGISLGPDGTDSNSSKAIEKISSLSFFENNVFSNIYLPDLMAFGSWIPETNTLVYDNKIFDTESKTWIREYKFPYQQIPSAQESYEAFIEEHLSLSEDKKTGFVTLSIKHQSPFVAKQWAELIVKEVDDFYRIKDKLESEKAVNYLNKQISLTSLSEIKEVLAQLLQEETKKLTLIEANQSYVFDYIDPPAVMEKKSEPSRILICIFGFLLGGILSVFLVLARHYIFSEKTI